MGLFKTSILKAKEDGKKFVIFEPTVMRKDSIEIKDKDRPKHLRGSSGGFAISLMSARKRFKGRLF